MCKRKKKNQVEREKMRKERETRKEEQRIQREERERKKKRESHGNDADYRGFRQRSVLYLACSIIIVVKYVTLIIMSRHE